LSQFKEYHPFGNLKLNNLGIFQSLKFRILKEIILPISLKLTFTPNALGCYGLKTRNIFQRRHGTDLIGLKFSDCILLKK